MMNSDERDVAIIIWRTRDEGRHRSGCRSRIDEERRGKHVRGRNLVFEMTL